MASGKAKERNDIQKVQSRSEMGFGTLAQPVWTEEKETTMDFVGYLSMRHSMTKMRRG